MPWLILAVMGAAAYLYGVHMQSTLLCLLSKPLPADEFEARFLQGHGGAPAS